MPAIQGVHRLLAAQFSTANDAPSAVFLIGAGVSVERAFDEGHRAGLADPDLAQVFEIQADALGPCFAASGSER